jgi:predicted HTH domain antitoxin
LKVGSLVSTAQLGGYDPVRYDNDSSDAGFVMREDKLMTETTLQVRVPTLLLHLGLDQNEVQRRLAEWLVLSPFTEGYISSGKAAHLMNISRIEFLAVLRARGIAYVNYTPDELAEEFAAVETLEVTPDR